MKKLITILMMAFVVTMISCADRPTHPQFTKLGLTLTADQLELTIPVAIKTAIEEITTGVDNYKEGGEAALPDPPSVSVTSDLAASITIENIVTHAGKSIIVPIEGIFLAFNDILQPDSTIVYGVDPNRAFTVVWVLEPSIPDPILTVSGTAIAKPGYFLSQTV